MIKERQISIRCAVIQGAMALLLGAFVAACAATPTTESTGGYIDDATITAKVKTALAADPQLRDPIQTPLQVRVETYKGVVQLSGFVNSPNTAQKAASDASDVPGVTRVVNNLIVKTESPANSG
ncbi:MAG TPA: BON domain-containing protein [Candidatus Binataceae bacterium]|nr:BON domain-containing protein [Candidatus Binataceae bacterium]